MTGTSAAGIPATRPSTRRTLVSTAPTGRPKAIAATETALKDLDAFAPAVFAKLGRGGGGKAVPTVEMTYHFRESMPLPGDEPGTWHLGIFRTQLARQGFIEEDGWLWTPSGVLLAQSRQMALLPHL